MQQCAYSKAAKDWMRLEEQLFCRGGSWRDASRPLEPRWILDCYEGPSRMRRRIQHVNTQLATMRTKSEVQSFRKLLQEMHNVCNSWWGLYRIRQTLRLEKTFKSIESNLWQISASLLWFSSPGSWIRWSMYREPTKGIWFWGVRKAAMYLNDFSSFLA